jgi:flagellar hook-associated protein 3 FlgL
MTAFRVTQNVTSRTVLANLQTSMQKMQDLQNQLSSGRQIVKPSDDPSGTVSAMSLRSDAKRTAQYSRNAQDGIGWLSTADTTLTSSLTSLQRVRELLLQGASSTTDKEGRSALADEIKNAKQSLIGLANTTYQDRPIFAGTANPTGQTPPQQVYDDAGNYNGNTAAIYRTIGPNAQVQVNVDGPSVWGTPGAEDMWHILDDIESHLRSGDPVEVNKLTNGYTDGSGPRKSDIDRLDGARLNIQTRMSEIGARTHRTEQMQNRADDNSLTIQSSLTTIENVDIAQTIVNLNLQSAAYQAALSATSRVIQPSLVDFLR